MLHGLGLVAPGARNVIKAFVLFGDTFLDFLETWWVDGVLDNLG